MKIIQENHTVGYWKGKSRDREFVRLTNFGLRLLGHVMAPKELPQHSGFIVEVSQKQCQHSVRGERTFVSKGLVLNYFNVEFMHNDYYYA